MMKNASLALFSLIFLIVASFSSANYLIADSGNNRVIEVDATGTIVWNSATTSLYTLSNPNAALKDSFGNYWIANTNNNSVIRAKANGTILTTISVPSPIAIAFNGPKLAILHTTGGTGASDRMNVSLFWTNGTLERHIYQWDGENYYCGVRGDLVFKGSNLVIGAGLIQSHGIAYRKIYEVNLTGTLINTVSLSDTTCGYVASVSISQDGYNNYLDAIDTASFRAHTYAGALYWSSPQNAKQSIRALDATSILAINNNVVFIINPATNATVWNSSALGLSLSGPQDAELVAGTFSINATSSVPDSLEIRTSLSQYNAGPLTIGNGRNVLANFFVNGIKVIPTGLTIPGFDITNPTGTCSITYDDGPTRNMGFETTVDLAALQLSSSWTDLYECAGGLLGGCPLNVSTNDMTSHAYEVTCVSGANTLKAKGFAENIGDYYNPQHFDSFTASATSGSVTNQVIAAAPATITARSTSSGPAKDTPRSFQYAIDTTDDLNMVMMPDDGGNFHAIGYSVPVFGCVNLINCYWRSSWVAQVRQTDLSALSGGWHSLVVKDDYANGVTTGGEFRVISVPFSVVDNCGGSYAPTSVLFVWYSNFTWYSSQTQTWIVDYVSASDDKLLQEGGKCAYAVYSGGVLNYSGQVSVDGYLGSVTIPKQPAANYSMVFSCSMPASDDQCYAPTTLTQNYSVLHSSCTGEWDNCGTSGACQTCSANNTVCADGVSVPNHASCNKATQACENAEANQQKACVGHEQYFVQASIPAMRPCNTAFQVTARVQNMSFNIDQSKAVKLCSVLVTAGPNGTDVTDPTYSDSPMVLDANAVFGGNWQWDSSNYAFACDTNYSVTVACSLYEAKPVRSATGQLAITSRQDCGDAQKTPVSQCQKNADGTNTGYYCDYTFALARSPACGCGSDFVVDNSSETGCVPTYGFDFGALIGALGWLTGGAFLLVVWLFWKPIVEFMKAMNSHKGGRS